MRGPYRSPLASTIVLLAACASTPSVDAPRPGDSKRTALEVCRPAGERAYLSRLVCADGTTPTVRRVANVGWRNDLPNGGPNLSGDAYAPLPPGVADWHIVDDYEVVCSGAKHAVFLDMYHCDQPPPTATPTGFTLRAPRP